MAPASEDTAGRYYCIYYKWSGWSQRSDFLELTVTDEDTTQGPPTSQALPSDPPGLSVLLSEHLYVLIGVSVACLLCLLFLVLLFRHLHRRTHRPPHSKREVHRPQERLSPSVQAQKGPPGVATEEKLPEDREKDTSAPVAGDPQEVTYAQLDHWTLTHGVARAVSPQPMEPTAESSTYATVSRS
ncbi:leukocyte-associated immunoglobulin-like receptor 1 [Tamandua tetradactyla]|uniref:leukocyte-associated immunoglobulin-like receptor 1 n=1 Tax=Tamandua tetradactyla TaxID=48850 RepID=UPI004053F722